MQVHGHGHERRSKLRIGKKIVDRLTVHLLFIIYPAPDTRRVSGTKNAEYSDPAESELLDPLHLYP